jgi:hypothetical protein
MTFLCEKTDMQNVLSAFGVEAFSDHEETGADNDAVIDFCRTQATGEMRGWIGQLYELTELSKSELVTAWVAVMSCYYLCMKRGNPIPDSLVDEYDRITNPQTGIIAQVQKEKFLIPDIRRKATNIPVFSNMTIDRRYRRETVRVTSANSSQLTPTKLEQDTAPEIVLDQ